MGRAGRTKYLIEGNKMAVPKRKKSKSKVRARRSSKPATLIASKECPKCGTPQQSHRACPDCGYYRDRQVVTRESE